MDIVASLDVSTLSVALCMTAFCLAAFQMVLKIANPRYAGPNHWAVGTAIFGFGFLLLISQERNLHFLGIIIANTAIVAGISLISTGTWLFLGHPKDFSRLTILAPIFIAISFFILTYIYPSTLIRLILISLVLAVQFLSSALVLLFRFPFSRKASALFTAGIYITITIFLIIRTILAKQIADGILFSINALNSLGFLNMLIAMIGWNFGLIFMGVSRMTDEIIEMETKQNHLERDSLVKVIIDTLPQNIVLKDKNSTYLLVNKSCARTLGKTPDQLEGSDDTQNFPLDLSEKYRADDISVMQSGEIRDIIEEFEYEGKRSWINSIKAPVYNEDGTLKGVLVVFRDISERLRTEQALMESERRFRDLNLKLSDLVEERTRELIQARRDVDLFFEVSLEFLCVLSLEGNILRLSPAWFKNLGWREEDLAGTSILDLIHPEDQEEVLRESEDLPNGDKVYNFTSRFRCADGSWLWLSWAAVGIPSRQLIIGSAHDITSRMEAEQQMIAARKAAEQASETKSQFIATMSHELRTPLNAVLGYNNLLAALINDDMANKYIQSISTSGKALLAIINDILDLTKVEAGRIELKPIPFDPRLLLKDLRDIFRFSAEEKGLDLLLRADTNVPKQVLLDIDRLRQVLINLVGNAIKFTATGSVSVFVNARSPDNSPLPTDERASFKVDLRIEVADTGMGIAKEYRDRLFEPFSQQDREISRQFGGTGLGLAIARRLLDLMNASIVWQENTGGGSRFIIDMPAVSAAGFSEELQMLVQGNGESETEKSLDPGEDTMTQIEVLVNKLNRANTKDDLTGLMNRRSITLRLSKECDKAAKSGIPLAVLIGDIDRLKSINDQYGYRYGDLVLSEAARRLYALLPHDTWIGRWAGEEFMAILPGFEEAQALSLAEELRQAVGMPFNKEEGPVIRASISMGVCICSSSIDTDTDAMAASIIRCADDALYQAKAYGRNRCEVLHLSNVPPAPPSGK